MLKRKQCFEINNDPLLKKVKLNHKNVKIRLFNSISSKSNIDNEVVTEQLLKDRYRMYAGTNSERYNECIKDIIYDEIELFDDNVFDSHGHKEYSKYVNLNTEKIIQHWWENGIVTIPKGTILWQVYQKYVRTDGVMVMFHPFNQLNVCLKNYKFKQVVTKRDINLTLGFNPYKGVTQNRDVELNSDDSDEDEFIDPEPFPFDSDDICGSDCEGVECKCNAESLEIWQEENGLMGPNDKEGYQLRKEMMFFDMYYLDGYIPLTTHYESGSFKFPQIYGNHTLKYINGKSTPEYTYKEARDKIGNLPYHLIKKCVHCGTKLFEMKQLFQNHDCEDFAYRQNMKKKIRNMPDICGTCLLK